jgi:hypothetical protein
MPRYQKHADGSSTAYEAVALHAFLNRMMGLAVRHGLTKDGPWCESGELLLDLYRELIEDYELVGYNNDNNLPYSEWHSELETLDLMELRLDLFLTDSGYCSFDRDSDAYKALMPRRARNVRWWAVLAKFSKHDPGYPPANWREQLEPPYPYGTKDKP